MRAVIADDSRIARLVLRRILRDAGHEVVAEAEEGAAAVEYCRKFEPDCVILDLSMQGMQGNEAAEIILRERLCPKVVIVSSMSQASIFSHLQQLGCQTISKPYDAERLVEVIA